MNIIEIIKEKSDNKKRMSNTINSIINTKPKCFEGKQKTIDFNEENILKPNNEDSKKDSTNIINDLCDVEGIIIDDSLTINELKRIIDICNKYKIADEQLPEYIKKINLIKAKAIKVLEKKLLAKIKILSTDIDYIESTIDINNLKNMEFRFQYLFLMKNDISNELINLDYRYTLRDSYRLLYSKCNKILNCLNSHLGRLNENEEAYQIRKAFK